MSVRRAVAALVGTALLLAGCSDDPEPRFTPPSESPSPTESATSAEPEAQTAEEFIGEWFRVGTEMQNTGETEAFLSLSSDCVACQTFAARVAGIYSAGGFIKIASEEVVRVEPLALSKTLKQFSVVVDAAPTKYRDSDSSKPASFPGGRNVYRMTLTVEGDTWAVQNYLDTPS
ncbi:MAG: hypothetical protein WKF50_06275 [Nocardioides sp.]